MTTKTIKGVDDQAWNDFKGLAARQGQSMGEFFSSLVSNYPKSNKERWKSIFNSGFLTDKEAEEIKKDALQFRKELGFR